VLEKPTPHSRLLNSVSQTGFYGIAEIFVKISAEDEKETKLLGNQAEKAEIINTAL
jgi:hypothetical protein